MPRDKRNEDELGLFRLYNSTVPHQIRCFEGITFQEWCQCRKRDAKKELVFEHKGEALAWMKIKLARKLIQFEAVTSNDAPKIVVDYSLSLFSGNKKIYWIVPEFQQGLQNALEEQGLHKVAEYACLTKQLTCRIKDPQLVPMQA